MLRRIKSLMQSTSAQGASHRADGDAHVHAGRMGDAEQSYRHAVAIDPRDVDAWVGLGYVLMEGGQPGPAGEALATALAIDPAKADAHYMLGAIAKGRGDVAAAIQAFAKAIECKPDFEFAYREQFALLAQAGQPERAREVLDRAAVACPGAADVHYMRGKFCDAQHDHAVALESYRKAVSLDPAFFEGHLAIADELRRMGDHGGAAGHYRDALALRPDSAAAHVNLGAVLQAQGKIEDAAASYRRAVEIDPRLTVANANLGSLLMTQGATQEAIACFERVLAVDPGNTVSYLLAGLKGGNSDRAPSDYVEKLFDWYSERFESHLVKDLHYNVPEELRDLLQPYATGQDRWTILDLGCGTGLVGAALAPFTRTLVGVDLSSKMLDKARARNLYDRLEQLDVVTMMQAEASSSYDLIIAADVFVYVGKLDALVEQARRLLRPGGHLAFSVESLDALAPDGEPPGDYRLIETGRFAHSAGYLARLCERNGFANVHTSRTQIRAHLGKGIEGYLVLWKQQHADPAAANAHSPNGNLRGTV